MNLNKIIVIAIFAILIISATNVADYIYTYNPQISRGILGLLIVYLTYKNGLLPIKEEPISALFSFPGNVKYFLFSFFGAIIIYWGLQQFIFMLVMKK